MRALVAILAVGLLCKCGFKDTNINQSCNAKNSCCEDGNAKCSLQQHADRNVQASPIAQAGQPLHREREVCACIMPRTA